MKDASEYAISQESLVSQKEIVMLSVVNEVKVTSGKHVGAMYTPLHPTAGVHLFFLFLLQNIDCGYVPTIYVLSTDKKNIIFFPMEFSIFAFEKNLCVLHGHIFIMNVIATF